MNKDRAALIGLAALALVALTAIALGTLFHEVKGEAVALLGTIAGGLVLFAKDIVTTIRAAWTDERTGALTDHLAASAPETQSAPRDAKEAAQDTADAAQQQADAISGK